MVVRMHLVVTLYVNRLSFNVIYVYIRIAYTEDKARHNHTKASAILLRPHKIDTFLSDINKVQSYVVTDGSSVTFGRNVILRDSTKRVIGFINKHKELQPQLH